ncbi:hypothetical protein P8C59_000858 [Phyllachora maydis]|uniref:Cytochrome P450 n=1 Tax=Phyllachora maydis TaxID=1825666 RepID=A0AAD9M739_9PEZI|nr:hypothetical protein P8C59_000858 [Phyllachora maydis]
MAVVVLLFVAVCAGLLAVRQYLAGKRLPPGVRELPGPKGIPYFGRIHDVPAEKTWLKFYEWSQQYGPIYKQEMFGATHVWISSEKVANDLMGKKASIYSDRPTIPNLPDNRTSGDYLALLGHTETWKRQRKLCNSLMHTSALASLHAYPTRERDRFLYLMWRDPANYVEWIEQLTSRTVSRLSWGSAHPARMLRETTFGLLQTISPAGALPNIVTFLRHVPHALSPWKQRERARHQLETATFRANLDFVRDEVASERALPSFIRTFLEGKKAAPGEHGAKEKWGDPTEAMNVVGLMAIAGALTIGSPVQSYVLAMLHFPDWQRKLAEEIDTVCEGRCPQWEDREKLPLLRAVVKEVIRWRPPVPTGIPHAVEADDVYEGYLIPKGAIIHPFEWGMTRNEDTYPDAETFNPARWLDPAFPTYRAPLTQHPNLSGFSQFGFGRRTCQGLPIVEQDLYLAMGGMAWAFTLRKKRDPVTGRDVPVHWNNYTALLIAKPEPFVFDALPRDEDKMALMSVMYEFAKDAEDAELEVEVPELTKEGSVDGKDSDESDSCASDSDVLVSVRESSPDTEVDDDDDDAAAAADAVEHAEKLVRVKALGSSQPKRDSVVLMQEMHAVPGAWAA